MTPTSLVRDSVGWGVLAAAFGLLFVGLGAAWLYRAWREITEWTIP